MSDGAKQFLAWTMAFGLSATVYGGGAYWLKKNATHHDHTAQKDGEAHHGQSHEPQKHDLALSAHHGDLQHEDSRHSTSKGSESEHHETAAHSEPVAHKEENHNPSLSASHDAHPPQNDHHPKDAIATHKVDETAAAHPAKEEHHSNHKDKHPDVHWTYAKNDAGGPAHWGDLAKNFATCEKGLEQSPIDISKAKPSKIAPKIDWHYGTASVHVENNGHTIQSNLADGKHFIEIDKEKFQLAQFHFHAPSEHRIGGIPSDMELHFVHKNSSGALAVIGVLINELAGRENKFFKPIWDIIPRDLNTKVETPAKVSLSSLMPTSRQFFHYQGSLTTPPCSEGVRWFVLKDPITMSSGQIEMYTSIFHGPTNRPVQPLQGREIITNGPPVLAH